MKKSVTYSPPSMERKFEIEHDLENKTLNITSARTPTKFNLDINQGTAKLSLMNTNSMGQVADLIAQEYLFSHNPDILTCVSSWGASTQRSNFYENPQLFHFRPDQTYESIETHQLPAKLMRPSYQDRSTLYRRYWPSTKLTVSIEVLNIDHHLNLFHNWQNQERVYKFWELNGSIEEHKDYCLKILNDPHALPVIIAYNGEPVGYFEIYWAMEDRLGPYYDVDPFDRGMHLLIGNTKYLGFNFTYTAWCSVTHFMFLEDCRTRQVVLEPRYDNDKILKYVKAVPSYKIVKEFDFPHKRAKLLSCDRLKFFSGNYL